MQSKLIRYFVFFSLWLPMNHVSAETLYVIDKLNIGLHEGQTLDTPITKVVPSGTTLTVISKSGDLIQVQTADGSIGWINAEYTVTAKPGRALLAQLEQENKALKKKLETAIEDPAENNESDNSRALKQKLNSERLKSGELQAQLADLHARIADIDDATELMKVIESLQDDKKQLIAQLEESGIEIRTTPASSNLFDHLGLKHLGIAFLVSLIGGMLLGAYLIDFFNRRRHGGFRV